MELGHTVSVNEYNELRRKVGWEQIPDEQAAKGLANTTYTAVFRDNGRLAAMARMISDSGFVAFLTDVMVSPEYQGQGLGYKMIENIKTFINTNIKEGQSVMLHVMSAKGKEGFYLKCGFEERPSDRFGSGMSMRLAK